MRRKKYFKTLREARHYIKKVYETKWVTDPRREDLQVFKHRKQYFVGTAFEFDCMRWS